MKYHLIIRTPDNSDGIYHGDQQVISARELEERGYSEYYLLGCTDKRIAQIVQEVRHDG